MVAIVRLTRHDAQRTARLRLPAADRRQEDHGQCEQRQREPDQPRLRAVVAQQHGPDRFEHADGEVERDARRERRLDRGPHEQRAQHVP